MLLWTWFTIFVRFIQVRVLRALRDQCRKLIPSMAWILDQLFMFSKSDSPASIFRKLQGMCEMDTALEPEQEDGCGNN